MAQKEGDTAIICANPDCRIAETGKCVEGLEPDKCPHFGHTPANVSGDKTVTDSLSATGGVRLPSADTLTVEGVAKLLRAGITRIVAIIGPTDAGKTSLIASLYDLFQEGPVSGVEYSRSLTLHAFERVCHDARDASRRRVPHINRTPLGEVRFYHFDLGGGSAGHALALAIGDRAGEEYRTAADDPAIVTGFPEIRRADSLALLVDGKRLLDAGDRHNVRSEVMMMLQGLVDGGAIQGGQRLALVLTKIDLIESSPNKARAEQDFASLFSTLERLFGHVFSAFQIFRIAASPETDIFPRGAGVPELFAFWLEPAAIALTPAPPKPVLARAFARLHLRDEPVGKV